MVQNDAGADVNRSAILAHLAANGPQSRAQLARTLHLSTALMSQLTRRLITDGLVIELENAPGPRGRPARLLGLNSTAGNAIGIRLGAEHITLVELGIDSTLIRSATERIDSGSAGFLSEVARLTQHFVEGSAPRPLLGVGVGVPGSVDDQSSGVVDSIVLGLDRAPVGTALQRALGLPVIVENDVKALAVGERLYGLGRHFDDFLVLTVGPEIGAALIVNGMIFRGSSGRAGDIGHVPIQEDGPRCECGNRGCLRAVIGQEALVRRARETGAIVEHGTITALGAAADAGHADAQAVFSQAGHLLGRVVAGIVQAVDPEVVIVLGEATASWNHWSFGFEPALQSGLPPGRPGMTVLVEPWQDLSWAQGAAALVFATPFDAEGVAGAQGRLVRARLFDHATPPND